MMANELTGSHIGSIIRFDWDLPSSRIAALITGELRQISHTSSDTVVQLTSHTQDTGGQLQEFVLYPGTPIAVHAEVRDF